jgi:CheY-like chemotaxis protein
LDAEQGERRVLIIDEEGDFNRSLSVYLSDLGLRTLTANLWTEALDRILDDRPHAILLNPHLSTVQGETILKFLREEGNQTPVVVVSDHLGGERIETLRALGANDFVKKTDAFYQIAQALSKALPGWSADDAPVITEDEFERVMDQRFKEMLAETEGEKKPREGWREPEPKPVRSPEAVETTAHRSPADTFSSPPEVTGYSQAPVSLPPPPPPLPTAEPPRQRTRVRRKRMRPRSTFKRIFMFLFGVCRGGGAVFMAVTWGITVFVRGGGVGTATETTKK